MKIDVVDDKDFSFDSEQFASSQAGNSIATQTFHEDDSQSETLSVRQSETKDGVSSYYKKHSSDSSMNKRQSLNIQDPIKL